MTDGENNEVKSETNSVDPEKAAKIVKQIEYYFGDVNMPRDRFLLAEIKKGNGWIPMETMLKFNRLTNISKDIDEIVNSLEQLSTLMEVSSGRDAIRRRPDAPVPESSIEYWNAIKKRTVYIKGFPQETTIDQLLSFFEGKGNIINLLMRKTKPGTERVFKGSIFLSFATEEEARKFAESSELKYKDVPLIMMMQEDYWASKHKEQKEKKLAEKALKKAKQVQEMNAAIESINSAYFVKGIVLKIHNVPSTMSFKAIKDFFNKYAEVAYAKLDQDKNEALVRFSTQEEDFAKKIWKKILDANGDVVKMGTEEGGQKEVTAEPLTGDEETAYWAEFSQQKLEKRDKRKSEKGGRHSKKGKDTAVTAGVKRKHIVFEQSDNEDETSSKKVATETTADQTNDAEASA